MKISSGWRRIRRVDYGGRVWPRSGILSCCCRQRRKQARPLAAAGQVPFFEPNLEKIVTNNWRPQGGFASKRPKTAVSDAEGGHFLYA